MTEAEQLREIAGDDKKVVSLAIGDVLVSPLKARQLGGFAQAIEPISGELGGLLAEAESGAGIKPGAVLSLLAKGDHLLNAISVATDRTVDDIGELEVDELLRLVMKVVEVNADFFTRRVLPVLGSLKAMAPATGTESASG